MGAGIADLPQGSLQASFGFETIVSPSQFIPATPFGPGVRAQPCDENGKVAKPVGERLPLA
jgi:hypothetical protein